MVLAAGHYGGKHQLHHAHQLDRPHPLQLLQRHVRRAWVHPSRMETSKALVGRKKSLLTHSVLILIQQILLNPEGFLKKLDVSGCSISHANGPKNYVYLAGNPHLTICRPQGPPREAKI